MSQTPAAPKTVLILAYFFPPRAASGAARPYRFYKYLPKFGFPTNVICDGSFPVPDDVFPAPGGPPPGRDALVAFVLEQIQRILFPNGFTLTWLPHVMTAAEPLMESGKVHAVLSTFPPVSTHLAGLWLKKKYGVKWIADFRDPLMGNAAVRSRIPVRKLLERAILKNADVVIVNTEYAAEKLRKSYPQRAHKVHAVWNGFDPDDRVQAATPPPRPRRILIHPGDIYSFRHPGRVLLSMDRLISRNLVPKDLGVVLQGDMDRPWNGIDDSAFDGLMTREWLECRNHRVSTDEARKLTAEAEYLLLLDVTGPVSGYQVPAKLFDYLCIGRPILVMTTRNSSVDWILSKSGVPYTCVYQDDTDEQVDEKVVSFFGLPTEPVKASPWFENLFNGENQARMLAKLLS